MRRTYGVHVKESENSGATLKSPAFGLTTIYKSELLKHIRVELLLYIKLRRLLYIELRLARDLYWLCRKLLLFNDLRAGRRAGRAITP